MPDTTSPTKLALDELGLVLSAIADSVNYADLKLENTSHPKEQQYWSIRLHTLRDVQNMLYDRIATLKHQE